MTGLKYSLTRLKSEDNVKVISNNIILEQGEIELLLKLLQCNRNMEFWYERHEIEYVATTKTNGVKVNQFKSYENTPLSIYSVTYIYSR